MLSSFTSGLRNGTVRGLGRRLCAPWASREEQWRSQSADDGPEAADEVTNPAPIRMNAADNQGFERDRGPRGAHRHERKAPTGLTLTAQPTTRIRMKGDDKGVTDFIKCGPTQPR
jgi:hypothetical protein